MANILKNNLIVQIFLIFIFLTVLVSVVFFTNFYVFLPKKIIEAKPDPWWNSSWQYRRPITLNWTGSALSNYQVRVVIDSSALITEGKLQPDCEDFRFIDSDDLTELNYWINDLESGLGCNQTETEIWVSIPSIPDGGKTIYVYYGNATAAGVSSFNNTFPNRLETSQTLSGTQNYDAVKLTSSKTITISTGSSLTINARYIYVDSTSEINGNEAGRTGGAGVGCANGNPGTGNDGTPGTDGGRAATHNCNQPSACPGCADVLCSFADDNEDGSGGGGGGSGGAGGQGGQSWATGDCDSRPGCGGSGYGSAGEETFYLGAGGGSGTGSCFAGNHGVGGAGGRGGGALKLNAIKIVYSGRIYLNGGNGQPGNCTTALYGCGGGGGGAGGQMILKGRKINVNDGIFEARGGNGGARSQTYGGAGGGGGGGRIKLFYENLSEVGATYNVSGGASGGASFKNPQASAGSEGTIYKGVITYPAPTISIGLEEEIAVVPPATWRAPENATTTINKFENIRLRISVANTGSEATDYDYRLEWAIKAGEICGDDEFFSPVPVTATTEHFEMTTSTYFTNGDPTTPQLSNPEEYTFVSGRMVENPSNSSGAITLPYENYTEVEFVFQATANAIDGQNYCFRLTNAGTSLDEYSVYPELQITP